MKTELVKKTIQLTGDVYYYVTYNGSMVSDTWTSDYEKAKQNLQTTIEKAQRFPADKYEVIESIEITEA